MGRAQPELIGYLHAGRKPPVLAIPLLLKVGIRAASPADGIFVGSLDGS